VALGPASTGPASAGTASTGLASAGTASAAAFLDELAHRVALGVTAVCTVLDPGLVVLGGEIGLAGGPVLADRVAAQVARMCPVQPRVIPTAVTSEPVLRGALLTAVDRARTDLLASV
jgi:predicted NBD/HSP70 family sugar kinase